MREDIVAGAVFPDYQLPDQAGVLRKLSELQGDNPMVLHLSRGSYDPKEHRFLRNLVDNYPEFRVAYTRLAVICTDNPLNLNEFRDSVGALWPFLGDPERTVQQDLGRVSRVERRHREVGQGQLGRGRHGGGLGGRVVPDEGDRAAGRGRADQVGVP